MSTAALASTTPAIDSAIDRALGEARIVGAVVLVSLPELFRFLADYRLLIYGIALLLLIRFRPQGLMGTV